MFCWLRFKFVFHQVLWPFWGNLRLHLAQFVKKKKPLRKSLQKKDPLPTWKRHPIPMSDGSQRRRLACALLNSNNSSSSNSSSISARARIVVRIRVQVWVDCNSKSKNCSKMAAWVGFDCKSFENNSKKWKGLISKLNARDLTRRLGQGPANSIGVPFVILWKIMEQIRFWV